jgi:hypothetical protein
MSGERSACISIPRSSFTKQYAALEFFNERLYSGPESCPPHHPPISMLDQHSSSWFSGSSRTIYIETLLMIELRLTPTFSRGYVQDY